MAKNSPKYKLLGQRMVGWAPQSRDIPHFEKTPKHEFENAKLGNKFIQKL